MRYFGNIDRQFLAVENSNIDERYMIAFQCYERDGDGSLDLCESNGRYAKNDQREIYKADGTRTTVAEVGYLAERYVKSSGLTLFHEGEEPYPEIQIGEIVSLSDWAEGETQRAKSVSINGVSYHCYEWQPSFLKNASFALKRRGSVTWYTRVE
jgi:hypothetical protein